MSRPEGIKTARRVTASFQAVTAKSRRSHHSVYIILLHDARALERWGLYVGQTARDPDLRFDQHKAG
jgi:hypothetical protein